MTTTIEQNLVTAYEYFAADRPLRDTTIQMPATISIGGQEAIAIGDDDGNGKKKIALLTPQAEVVTLEIPASYKEAAEIRMGAGLTTYRVNDGPEFWIGEDAVRNGGDALPIGATAQRLSDARHRDFGVACVMEALRKAGYTPDTYPIALARAIPNEEVQTKKKTTDDGTTIEMLRVKKETREALKSHLQGKTFSIVRTDPLGHEEHWTLRYVYIAPQAQSIGTFIALTRDLYGRNSLPDIEAMRVNDTGGGDDQLIEVIHDRGNWRMTGRRLGNGTIDIARAVAHQFPALQLNDAQAQHSLEQRSIRNEAGRRQQIDAEIKRAVQAEGQDMIGRKLSILQERGYFLVFTGGGVRLPELRQMIEERARLAEKREGHDYMFVDSHVAGTLNAFGVLLMLIFAASGRGV